MTFGPSDMVTESSHNDPLVVRVRLNRHEVKQVLVDTGSSVNLLTLEVYNKLGLDKNNLTKNSYPLVILRDKTMTILGIVNLSLVLWDEKNKEKCMQSLQ